MIKWVDATYLKLDLESSKTRKVFTPCTWLKLKDRAKCSICSLWCSGWYNSRCSNQCSSFIQVHDNGPSIMDVILKESKNFNELWNIIRIRDPLCRDDLQLEVWWRHQTKSISSFISIRIILELWVIIECLINSGKFQSVLFLGSSWALLSVECHWNTVGLLQIEYF